MGDRSELLRLMKVLEARKAAAPPDGAGINFDALADGSAADMPEYADLFMPSGITDIVEVEIAELANGG
jgi:hypothetical protein